MPAAKGSARTPLGPITQISFFYFSFYERFKLSQPNSTLVKSDHKPNRPFQYETYELLSIGKKYEGEFSLFSWPTTTNLDEIFNPKAATVKTFQGS